MSTSNPIPDPGEEELAPNSKQNEDGSSVLPAQENRPFVMPGRAGGIGGKDKTTRMMLVVGALLLLFIVSFRQACVDQKRYPCATQ